MDGTKLRESEQHSVEDFWDYSNRIYRSEGVQEACLALQNSHGLDVNIALFSCWFGCAYGIAPDELFAKAVSYSSIWRRNVVEPLRSARSWLKGEIQSGRFASEESTMVLREEIKSVELNAERLQQHQLQALARDHTVVASDPLVATVTNLKTYLALAHLEISNEVGSLLKTLVVAAVPGAPEGLVSYTLAHQR